MMIDIDLGIDLRALKFETRLKLGLKCNECVLSCATSLQPFIIIIIKIEFFFGACMGRTQQFNIYVGVS